MPLRCTNCVELDGFRRTAIGHANYTETEYLDSNGECVDTGGEEFDDYQVDDYESIECSDCGETEGVEDISQEDWDRYKQEGEPTKIKSWKEKYKNE